MGRDKLKITELNPDYAYGIRKLCDGNLKLFYDNWIRGSIDIYAFYSAMKVGTNISQSVEEDIETSYFEALGSYGLSHEQLACIPTFKSLFHNLLSSDRLSEDTQIALKFYSRLFDEDIIRFEKKKKSGLMR